MATPDKKAEQEKREREEASFKAQSQTAKEAKAAAKKAPASAAEKAKAKEAAKIDKEKAAAEKAKAQRAAQKEAKPQLEALAHEINERVALAEKMFDKADDHRLAAAIRLGEAKTKCDAVGMSFKDWATANIKDQTFQTIRKLAAVGLTPKEEGGPAKALADLREKHKVTSQKSRKKVKKARALNPEAGKSTAPEGNKGPTTTPFKAASDALHRLDERAIRAIVESEASKFGTKLVPAEEYAKLTGGSVASASTLCKAFDKLAAKDKLDVIGHIEAATNMQFVSKEIAAAGRKTLAE